jgi:hypothetical protein
VKTYASSHIPQSLSAAPVGQVGQIIGNVVTGLGKIASIAIGAGASASLNNCGPTATKYLTQIGKWKDAVDKLKDELASGVSSDVIKKDTDTIQALQTLIADTQTQHLTITIKQTIDLGVTATTPISGDSNNQQTPKQTPVAKISKGLIARFMPSAKKLAAAGWLPTGSTELPAKWLPLFAVNIYLDFANGYPIVEAGDSYEQTKFDRAKYQYREAAYIPVLTWRGERQPGVVTYGSDGTEEAGPAELSAPQTMAFAQFGSGQNLPYDAGYFGNLNWQVDFLEHGEITTAVFVSKSTIANFTSTFAGVAGTASTVAGEVQNQASAQANGIQAQADMIYKSHRLAVCQANAATCPSK